MSTPTRSRTPLILAVVGAVACLGLAMVLVIGGLGTALYVRTAAPATSSPDAGAPPPSSEDPSEADEPTDEPSAADAPTDEPSEADAPTDEPSATDAPAEDPSADDPSPGASPSPAEAIVPPPGVGADQPYLELSTSEDGPVVDVYIDFLCPPCRTFWEVNGEDLISAALGGEAILRVHPRPMLDAGSEPAGYSGRAANASVCAFAEKPEWWFPAAITLFENQPEAAGLTDEELIDLVSEAEVGGDVAGCITDGTYVPWLEQVVEAEALEATTGTPTVLIDGEAFETGLFTEGALRAAIEAA